MLRSLCAFLWLAAILPAAAELPNEKTIADLYARALAGESEAVVRCIDSLEKVLTARPQDELARVYLGSAYTLRSRDLSVFGLAKLTALRHGNALMDEAAAAAPNDAKVQLLRAVTYEAFPTVLGKRQIAREALEHLVATVAKEPSSLRPNDQELLYLNAGEAAQKAGDHARARELWKRGLALAADPRLTTEIRAALHQLGN